MVINVHDCEAIKNKKKKKKKVLFKFDWVWSGWDTWREVAYGPVGAHRKVHFHWSYRYDDSLSLLFSLLRLETRFILFLIMILFWVRPFRFQI